MYNVKQDGSNQVSTMIRDDLIGDVGVVLEARLGKSSITLRELLALQPGALVTLETCLADKVELFLNDKLVATGDLVAVGDNYAVRIVDLAPLS